MSQIPVAAWSKEWVFGRSPAEGSNPYGGMENFLLWMLYDLWT